MKPTTDVTSLKPRLIRAKQAAAYLGISAWSLRALVHEGIVPVVRHTGTGPMLFDVRDLDEHIERSKTQAGANPPGGGQGTSAVGVPPKFSYKKEKAP